MSKVIKLFQTTDDAAKDILEYLNENINNIEDIICIVSLKDTQQFAVLNNGMPLDTKCFMKELLAKEIMDEIYEES